MSDIKYKITKEVGVFAENSKGWTKEINMASWNGAEPKYDIRSWSPNHERMGKGITLTKEELAALKEILDKEIE